MRIVMILATCLAFACTAFADEKADVQIGLSSDTVEITSNFDGTDIVIFGSIEGGNQALLEARGYDVVVALFGPKEEVVVRRKERKLGIWVNGEAMRFSDVPSSYSVATTRALDEIADEESISLLQLGLDNINVVTEEDGGVGEELEEFRESLARLKVSQSLFLERIGGVEFLSPTLFKAKLAVPANVPIGKHTAHAFLFKQGKFLNAKFAEMQVKKIGFEQLTYDLAHKNSLLYGFLAVFVAMATGWLASVVFGKD
ncbi:MAG: TIGR02186 family protein [Rhizobiaceae bacterium]